MQDHYDTLGIPRNSTEEQIKAAYRSKAKDCHPDHGETRETRPFRDLHEAYTVLCDPVRKASYDRQLGQEGDGVAGARSCQATAPIRNRPRCRAEPLQAAGFPYPTPNPRSDVTNADATAQTWFDPLVDRAPGPVCFNMRLRCPPTVALPLLLRALTQWEWGIRSPQDDVIG